MLSPVRGRSEQEPRRRSALRPLLTPVLGLIAAGAAFLYLSRLETRVAPPALPEGVVFEAGEAGERGWRSQIGALEEADREILDRQRARVDAWARRHVGRSLDGSLRDLADLQTLVERVALEPHQTLELQAFGVALGDVLARQLQLRWVVFRDELGRSRALQVDDSELLVFPVTMLSKRIERSLPVDVRELYVSAARRVEEMRRAGSAARR